MSLWERALRLLDRGVDLLDRLLNDPPTPVAPKVPPIPKVDRRPRTIPPPRPLGHDEKTPAETPRAKRRP